MADIGKQDIEATRASSRATELNAYNEQHNRRAIEELKLESVDTWMRMVGQESDGLASETFFRLARGGYFTMLSHRDYLGIRDRETPSIHWMSWMEDSPFQGLIFNDRHSFMDFSGSIDGPVELDRAVVVSTESSEHHYSNKPDDSLFGIQGLLVPPNNNFFKPFKDRIITSRRERLTASFLRLEPEFIVTTSLPHGGKRLSKHTLRTSSVGKRLIVGQIDLDVDDAVDKHRLKGFIDTLSAAENEALADIISKNYRKIAARLPGFNGFMLDAGSTSIKELETALNGSSIYDSVGSEALAQRWAIFDKGYGIGQLNTGELDVIKRAVDKQIEKDQEELAETKCHLDGIVTVYVKQ